MFADCSTGGTCSTAYGRPSIRMRAVWRNSRRATCTTASIVVRGTVRTESGTVSGRPEQGCEPEHPHRESQHEPRGILFACLFWDVPPDLSSVGGMESRRAGIGFGQGVSCCTCMAFIYSLDVAFAMAAPLRPSHFQFVPVLRVHHSLMCSQAPHSRG